MGWEGDPYLKFSLGRTPASLHAIDVAWWPFSPGVLVPWPSGGALNHLTWHCAMAIFLNRKKNLF